MSGFLKRLENHIHSVTMWGGPFLRMINESWTRLPLRLINESWTRLPGRNTSIDTATAGSRFPLQWLEHPHVVTAVSDAVVRDVLPGTATYPNS